MTHQNSVTMGAYKLASQQPDFLAHALERYRMTHQLDEATLCAGLGIRQATLWQLGMYRCDANKIDISQIVRQFNLEPDPLLEVCNWAGLDGVNENPTQHKLSLEITQPPQASPKQFISAPKNAPATTVPDFEMLVHIFKEHPSLDARKSAARALGLMKDARAIEPLLEVFNKECSSVQWLTQWHTLDAVGKLGNRQAVKLIIQALETFRVTYEDLLVKAIETLGILGGEEATAQLINLLQDEDDYIRFTAIGALGNLEGTLVLDALISVEQNDDDIQNRTKAAEVITKIKQRQQEERFIL